MSVYKSYQEQVQILGDKGYLSENFKRGDLIGYWHREFEQQYDQARYLAAETGQPHRFTIDAYGKFNSALETIKFTLEYEYSPLKNAVRFKSLYATLGAAYQKYKPTSAGEPHPAAKVAADIQSFAALNKSFDLHNALTKEYNRQRNRKNDFQEHADDPPVTHGRNWRKVRLNADDDARPYRREQHKMRLKR